jgi:O-acetyl-ADP-ribose deacetylase (regulator of RNase III)
LSFDIDRLMIPCQKREVVSGNLIGQKPPLMSGMCAAMKTDQVVNRIEVVEGDITQQRVDAIVNAANTSLLGGGGVDGAIHRAAGPELLEECRALGGCPTGEAKITKGHKLPAQWVIHTVGPVWRGGRQGEEQLLASCYRHSIALAQQKGVRTIAFPSISTGAYGFPMHKAAQIAVAEITRFLEGNSSMEKVVLVCFGKSAFDIHRNAVAEIRMTNDK